MKRRELIVSALAFGCLPGLPSAQPGAHTFRLIYFWDVTVSPEPLGGSNLAILKARLARQGFSEDRNLELRRISLPRGEAEVREALDAALQWKPDVVFAEATFLARQVQRATSRIPIVFVNVADPLRARLVTNLARPGGNTTGVTQFYVALAFKRLELTREILPHARRVALIWDRSFQYNPGFHEEYIEAARRLNLEVVEGDMSKGAGSWDDTFEQVLPAHPDALIPLGPWPSLRDRTPFKSPFPGFQDRTGIPVIFGGMIPTAERCLVQVGADIEDHYGRAAELVARILAGEKPGDIPVDQDTRIVMRINLGTARQLGIKLPKSVLLRADRVIE